jgi:predicted nucleic acid-binding protein
MKRKFFLFLLIATTITSAQIYLPHPIYGYVFIDSNPAENVTVEVKNLRTGAIEITRTDENGVWSANLANMEGGYRDGDTILVIASVGGREANTSLIVDGSLAVQKAENLTISEATHHSFFPISIAIIPLLVSIFISIFIFIFIYLRRR